MKKFLLAALLAVVAGCSTSPPPSTTVAIEPALAPVDLLKSETVALVKSAADLGDLAPENETDARSFCSGVWVSERTVLTAEHCTQDKPLGTEFKIATERDVFPPNSFSPYAHTNTRTAVLYARDATHDLALLGVTGPVPPHGVARVHRGALEPGQFSCTVGHPLGLWWSYSSGVISGVRKMDDGYVNIVLVQTTTPTNPGNSGGGLFDISGALIGVGHAVVVDSQNLGFYIHPMYIQAFLDRTPL